MQIPYYHIDAFTDHLFSGNPAGVCPLSNWLSDDLMQKIAFENNLSETAFFIPQGDDYAIRWFTPGGEVDLCGHATLASAYVVFNHLKPNTSSVKFSSARGPLYVTQNSDSYLQLDFPATPPKPTEIPKILIDAINLPIQEMHASIDYLVILKNEEQVQNLKPDFQKLSQLDLRGVIVSAPGNSCDFVSRFFLPKYLLPEDPVTGSTHCALTPYWAKRLNKKKLIGRQLSRRGGEILCELQDDRVILGGKAVSYLEATITIPDEK